MNQDREIKFLQMQDRSQLKRQNWQPGQQDENIIDQLVYDKFLTLMNDCRWQKLKQRINQFYGRNFSIKYRDSYKFKEQWQDYIKDEEKPFIDTIHDEKFVFRFMYWFIMFSSTFVVWAMTILRVFRPYKTLDNLGQSTVVVGFIGRLYSIFLKLYFRCRLMEVINAKVIIKTIIWDALVLIYMGISFMNAIVYHPIQMLLQISIWAYLFCQAKNIYKQVKLLTASLLYQSKLKIADLMITSLIVTHFGSLLFYMASWNHDGSSWIISAGVQSADYFTQYVYSFYFCSTTILTIGYGDMTPQNLKQIIIVTLIQFIGVIIFAYIINQIGHTLSLMRQSQESLQKDMKTLRRIQEIYKLDEGLVKRAKNYLAHNETVVDHITSQEQSRVFGKLSQELSSQIVFEKSLTVIKSSIFFVCRWSKQLQNSVANHIQKVLLAPKEKLAQPPSCQRIYIVKLGKIDIYIDRFGHSKKDYRRFLRSIYRTQNSQIGANIYGYTAVISTKPCALDAVASDFTTCYYINKENFFKCVNRSKLDKEYLLQIKTKMDLSEFCEAFEAPQILNIRQHFNPSRTILIRKQRAKLQKLSNKRQSFIRSERRFYKCHLEKYQEIKKAIKDKILSNSMDFQEGTIVQNENDDKDYNDMQMKRNQRKRSSEQEFRQNQKTIITLLNPLLQRTTTILLKTQLPQFFQKGKQYFNYFPYCNLKSVLRCLHNQNYNFNPKSVKNVKRIKESIKRTKPKKDQ